MSSLLNTDIHPAELYDPERHDNQIVAVFADEAAASHARDALREAGLPESAIRVVTAPEGEAPQVSQSAGDQIMDAFMSLLSAGEERHDYAHAVKSGHAMVIVTPPPETDRHLVASVLERCDPIDFDAKLEEWRQAGYEGMRDEKRGVQPVARRELLRKAPRVRSYIAERPANTEGGSTVTDTGTVTNATPGVESSGMNSPRR